MVAEVSLISVTLNEFSDEIELVDEELDEEKEAWFSGSSLLSADK